MHVHTAVIATYGTGGRMSATYGKEWDSDARPATVRVDGYNRDTAEAAADAAVSAVLAFATRNGYDVAAFAEWANVAGAVVGRIGPNRFAVTFVGTSA